MSTQVTLTLEDDVAQTANRLLRGSGQTLGDFLTDTITQSFFPLGRSADGKPKLTEMGDAEVLQLVELQIESGPASRMSELLDAQQAGTLTRAGRAELAGLMGACPAITGDHPHLMCVLRRIKLQLCRP